MKIDQYTFSNLNNRENWKRMIKISGTHGTTTGLTFMPSESQETERECGAKKTFEVYNFRNLK